MRRPVRLAFLCGVLILLIGWCTEASGCPRTCPACQRGLSTFENDPATGNAKMECVSARCDVMPWCFEVAVFGKTLLTSLVPWLPGSHKRTVSVHVTEPDMEFLTGPESRVVVSDGRATVCISETFEFSVPIADKQGNDGSITFSLAYTEPQVCPGSCPCSGGGTCPAITAHSRMEQEDRRLSIHVSASDSDGDLACIGFDDSGVSHGRIAHSQNSERRSPRLIARCEDNLVYESDSCENGHDMIAAWARDSKGNVGWSSPIALVLRNLCAIDSEVEVPAGGIAELRMGCTHPDAFPDLTYHIETTEIPGVGEINGTPPQCNLSVSAMTCEESVVIPYTIRAPDGRETTGRITVRIAGHQARIFDAMVALHRGEEASVDIAIEVCRHEFLRLDVNPLSGSGVYATKEGGLTFSAAGYWLQPVRIIVDQDARLGRYPIPMYVDWTGPTVVSGTLTVDVTNEKPAWTPTSRSTVFDAWIPRGHGAGPLYILDPGWEQSYCFRAVDPDGDDLTFYVNRSPRHGQAGVVPVGSGGSYEVHATYLPDADALVDAHHSESPVRDTFSVITRDAYGGRAEAFVSVRINVLNRIPVAENDDALTDWNTPVAIPVLDNDSDGDGDALTIASIGHPQHGTAIAVDTQILYSPENGFVGVDSFTYGISDGHGGSASAGVTVEVILTDSVPPTIVCPPDVDVPADADECSAMPAIGPPVAADDQGRPSVAGTRSDGLLLGSPYPVGTTTIVWTARDGAGNTATCPQQISVRDEQPPTIDAPADIDTVADAGRCDATLAIGTPTASDACGSVTVSGVRDDGQGLSDPYPVGTTLITWTANDGSGNAASCTQQVKVTDAEVPTIMGCPADLAVSCNPGQCGASVAWIEPTAVDSCDGVLSYSTRSHASGSIFGTGTTAVEYQFTDTAGNVAGCTFDVTVNDDDPPSMGCPGDVATGTDPGACGAIVTYDVTASDPCGASVDQISGLPSGALFLVGTTVNRFRATDASGNTSECEFQVEVEDHEQPTIEGGPTGDVERNVATGSCEATATWSEPTASDNCGVQSLSGTHALGDTFSVGRTTVTYTATDVNGNASSLSFDVVVRDGQPPTIDAPADIDTVADAGRCDATLAIGTPTASDACGSVTVSGTRDDAQTFIDPYPVGMTSITWTAEDASGNTASCTQQVEVTDAEAPTFSNAPGDRTVSNTPGHCSGTASWMTPTVTDGCGLQSLTSTHSSGSTFPMGNTTVTYTARDVHGNTSTCSFIITVNDTEAPTIAGVPQDVTVPRDTGCTATVDWIEPAASDNCDGEVPYSSRSHAPGSAFDGGTTSVVYQYTDSANNTATCSFDITVEDTTAPTVTCPGDINGSTTNPGGAIVTFSPSASDNCDPSPTIICTPSSGSTFPIGTTTVECQATDAAGNTSSPCTFDVTISLSNRDPHAGDDWASMDHGEDSIEIEALLNDSDPDNDPLTITQLGWISCGDALITSGGTRIEYEVDGCAQSMVSFTYKISDGRGGTDWGTVRVSLPPNSSPHANDDQVTMQTGQGTIAIYVLGNDWDPDGDSLEIESVGTPPCGQTSTNGSYITYDTMNCGLPPGSVVSFDYSINDGYGGTDTATVEVALPTGPRCPPPSP